MKDDRILLKHFLHIHADTHSLSWTLFFQDVHITGFAAQSCNIKPFHHEGFIPEQGKSDFDMEKQILGHYISSEWRSNHFKSLLDKKSQAQTPKS